MPTEHGANLHGVLHNILKDGVAAYFTYSDLSGLGLQSL
jgi:hypothetical protein